MKISEKIITIFGTSNACPGDGVFEIACVIGEKLARRGFGIANGGYGGTMLAAAEGAARANGRIVGVTCSAFGRSGANRYITEEIRTDSLNQRLGRLIELGDAYIVLSGGTGTLLELAEVWELKNKHFFTEDKPVIMVGEFWKPLMDMIASVDPGSIDCVRTAETADQVIGIIDEYFADQEQDRI